MARQVALVKWYVLLLFSLAGHFITLFGLGDAHKCDYERHDDYDYGTYELFTGADQARVKTLQMIRSLEVISALSPLIPSPAFPSSMFPSPHSGFDIRSRLFLDDLATSSLSYAAGTKDDDDAAFAQTGPFTFSPQAASTPKLGRGVGAIWLEPPGDGMCDGTCGSCPFEDREGFDEEDEAGEGVAQMWRWRESNSGASESTPGSIPPLTSFQTSKARSGVWKFGAGDATLFGCDGEGGTPEGGLGISMKWARLKDVFDGDGSREMHLEEPGEVLPVAWRRKRAKGGLFRGGVRG